MLLIPLKNTYEFHFQLKDEELNKSWIDFVHRKGWARLQIQYYASFIFLKETELD